MAATLINATGLQWGVAEDEDGLVIEKVSRSFKQKEKPVLSKQGETIGFSFYDVSMDLTIGGLMKATGALATLALGATATVANADEGRGVTGGRLILHEATEDEVVEDFMKVELKMTRHPLVPAS